MEIRLERQAGTKLGQGGELKVTEASFPKAIETSSTAAGRDVAEYGGQETCEEVVSGMNYSGSPRMEGNGWI